MTYPNELPISRHGRERMQQRGIRLRIMAAVWSHGDVTFHAGDGCEVVRASNDCIAGLICDGILTPDDARRAQRISLVAGRAGVITALRAARGRIGRRYRRQGITRAVA